MGYVQLANSQNYSNENNEMVVNPDMKVPSTKIPPISMNVGPLIRAVLERVWVTKYFGTPAEIYQISSDMPLCKALPDSLPKQETKSGTILWQQKCLPLEIRWKENKEDLSGTAVLRMLDFDKADEVLEEAFGIIRANSLGAYKIEEEKKDVIKNLIKEELEPYNSKFPINYKYKLKTYSILEDYYFSEYTVKGDPDTTNNFEKREEEIKKYFSHRGRKHALTIQYNSTEFVKTGNMIEYSLTAPAGFFGMERQYKNGRVP